MPNPLTLSCFTYIGDVTKSQSEEYYVEAPCFIDKKRSDVVSFFVHSSSLLFFIVSSHWGGAKVASGYFSFNMDDNKRETT